MYSKLLIEGTIEVVTGMHIGGSDAFAAIGAVDSPVIKDGRTQEPIIPGSTLKGKMRTLLARSLSQSIVLKQPNEDELEIRRLFGTSQAKGNEKTLLHSRLIFSDCYLTNKEQLIKTGGMTEVKFENTINRQTAIANPRQIERVVRGAEFGLRIVYDVLEESELEVDFKNIYRAFKLLEMDYLGGHGTRGSGRVKIKNLVVSQTMSSNVTEEQIDKLNEILKGE
ncbi:MAG: type III-A CRISPR-associated RAMP protein Csm3 [Peptococcaceae bacterium]